MNTPGCQGLATVDSQWKTKCVFFLSCMEMEDKKTVPACRRLSVHLLVLRISFSHTHFDSSRPVRSHKPKNTGGGSVRFLSRAPLYLPVCLRFSFLDTNQQPLMQKNGPARFQFISWTSVNQMSTVSSPPTFRHLSLEQARGQKVDGWQQATWCNRSSYWTVWSSGQNNTHAGVNVMNWSNNVLFLLSIRYQAGGKLPGNPVTFIFSADFIFICFWLLTLGA